MARIYAHKRGKAGSTRPVRSSAPSWVRYTPDELVKIIVKLRKEGMDASKIGINLRDQYGVPTVKLILGKPISKVLAENKVGPEYPDDLFNLMKKAVTIRKHLNNALLDRHSRRGLQNTEMKILRLVKYYKRSGKLPEGWKYDPKQAAIIVSGR